MSAIDIAILAAGKGTRMGSNIPKVLHKVANRSLLSHVYAKLLELRAVYPKGKTVVLHGPNQQEEFRRELQNEFPEHHDIEFVLQTERLGTGHAARCAVEPLEKTNPVLLLYGDQPLMHKDGLAHMIDTALKGTFCLATFRPRTPTGYGRIIQDEAGLITAIVEEKDATKDTRTIKLCNAGVMAIPPQTIGLLENIQNNNVAGEYYLTDLVTLAVANSTPIEHHLFSEDELCAVNTLAQLAETETVWQRLRRQELLQNGVSMQAPETVYFSVDTNIASGSYIEPHVYFGRNVTISGPSTIRAYSHLEGTTIGSDCIVGPFSRIRPTSQLEDDVKVGNFVEIKNTRLGNHVRANHHSYLGDAVLEKYVNIGAGTITCNYDGMEKNQTLIKESAFIGSNCSLVAPLIVAEGSILGAGSVITENNHAGDLSMERNRQINIRGAASRFRQRHKK